MYCESPQKVSSSLSISTISDMRNELVDFRLSIKNSSQKKIQESAVTQASSPKKSVTLHYPNPLTFSTKVEKPQQGFKVIKIENQSPNRQLSNERNSYLDKNLQDELKHVRQTTRQTVPQASRQSTYERLMTRHESPRPELTFLAAGTLTQGPKQPTYLSSLPYPPKQPYGAEKIQAFKQRKASLIEIKQEIYHVPRSRSIVEFDANKWNLTRNSLTREIPTQPNAMSLIKLDLKLQQAREEHSFDYLSNLHHLKQKIEQIMSK